MCINYSKYNEIKEWFYLISILGIVVLFVNNSINIFSSAYIPYINMVYSAILIFYNILMLLYIYNYCIYNKYIQSNIERIYNGSVTVISIAYYTNIWIMFLAMFTA